jgi:N-ATPase, AtpR subunit
MPAALHIVAFLGLGILLGAGYFSLLFVAVGSDRLGSAGPARPVMQHLVRLAVAAVGFWLVAQFGASALLASLAGFTAVLSTLRPLTMS